MSDSIERLRIYRNARDLEDQCYEISKADAGNREAFPLHRYSAAVVHHIAQAHRLYSYRLKIDELKAGQGHAALAIDELHKLNPTEHATLIESYHSTIR